MISVIVPTCNRNESLIECLNLLSPNQQTINNVEYEIIVTDDSKNDIAEKLIETNYPFIRWISGPKVGPAANRNNGAKSANGEWLIFIDDDCLPQKDLLVSYFKSFNNIQKSLVLEGCTRPDREKRRFDEESPVNEHGGKLWSCNFSIQKNFFEDLGGFDETFPYAAMEDIDFYNRVKEKTNILFIPDAIVIHPWRRIKVFKSFKKHFRSHLHFVKKYQHDNKYKYRLIRTKIFIGSVLNVKDLIKYSLKGWLWYVEQCFLNFCLIFI